VWWVDGLREPARAMTTADEVFTEHRTLLFTVAYEMLGSAGG
jgi:hypothetical protein